MNKYSNIRLGQTALLSGKYPCRIVDVASNGIWIVRKATEGEFIRKGIDQVRERVSIKSLSF